MAASGTFIVYSESVDYPGPPWGRAAMQTQTTLNWYLDDNNFWTCTYGNTTGDLTWYPCSSFPKAPSYQMAMDVQFSPNGTDWVTVFHTGRDIPTCGTSEAANYRVWQHMRDNIGDFHGYQMTEPGYMRVIYYATKPPYPSASFRYAYPHSPYASQSAQAHIPFSWADETENFNIGYRPGERRVSGTWQSHQRGGKINKTYAERRNGAWYELKTKRGDENAQGTPPERKRSNDWYNQKALGAGKDDR